MHARLIAASVLVVLSLDAYAMHLCSVDRVAKQAGSVRVFLAPTHSFRGVFNPATGASTHALNPDGSFELREGEIASFGALPHDSCTAKVLSRGDKLGVELDATTCMINMGCVGGKEFVEAE